MVKNLLILLLLYYSVKAEYEYEIIEEFIPKTIVSASVNKIFKYHLSCEKDRNKTSIKFQTMINLHEYSLLLYSNFTKIEKDDEGYYINYDLKKSINFNDQIITINNLTCNEDYYFVIYNYYFNMIDNKPTSYIQFSIINNETNTFNISPSLSSDYTLFPREGHTKVNFYYFFNEIKYAIIHYDGSIEIKQNDKITIYSNKISLIKFDKDLEYFIIYNSQYPIHIQFYNENSFFKYNLEDFPIMFYGTNNEYSFEINISDYNVGDYIVLQSSYEAKWEISYQYKSDYIKDNFINLGEYDELNYIPIKKAKNDSSLLLHIKYKAMFPYYFLFLINLLKIKAMEIDSDFNSTIKGPKFIILNYQKLNGLKSFAIGSNKNFAFFEQEIDNYKRKINKEYNNIFIYNQNVEESQKYKIGYIFLDTTDDWNFEIKRFNFTIITIMELSDGYNYYDLCQGEESKKEIYFYKRIPRTLQVFTPVFGSFDSFFIEETEIKTLSDFDFNKAKQINSFISENHSGYIKIVCKEPAMIKHIYKSSINQEYTLSTGKRYFFSSTKSYGINMEDAYIGKTISLKFSLIGTKNNYQMKLYVNETEYLLGNESLEFELEYTKKDFGHYFIQIEEGEDIKEEILIELAVGMKEDLQNYKILNLNESFGNLIINKKEGVIIKVPKEFNERYYNYSIIQQSHIHCFIEISYDKLEFMTFNRQRNDFYENSLVIPLFNVNPYSYIPKNSVKSDEKYFYILIYNYGYYQNDIFIKKPKLFTDLKLKKVYSFPQLKGEDEQYYYRIPFPNDDYDSLSIQTYKNKNFSFSLTQDNIIYPLYSNEKELYSLYSIPIDKRDILNKNYYLNYYGANFIDGYLNFLVGDEFIQSEIDKSIDPKFSIRQIEKTNNFTIKFKSCFYYFYRPVIYYLIINEPSDDKTIYSALSEKRIFDKNKTILKLEDNGESTYYQQEVEIDKELIEAHYSDSRGYTNNNMTVVPVDKETNLVLLKNIFSTGFTYIKKIKSVESEESDYSWIIIILVILLLLVIIIGFLTYREKKKEKNNIIEEKNIMNEQILSDN